MKTSLRTNRAIARGTFSGLLLFAASVWGAVEDKIEKQFAVSPGGALKMEVDRGSIDVKAADVSEVTVRVTRTAGGSQSRAEETLKQHEVSFSQEGNQVFVRAQWKGPKVRGWFIDCIAPAGRWDAFWRELAAAKRAGAPWLARSAAEAAS